MSTVRSDELGRLRALSDAGIALTSELSLQAVLQTIVQVAREQIDTQYAALSVLGSDGVIKQFITEGMSDDEQKAIGHRPVGRGLLGLMLRKGDSLRIDSLASDPRYSGFPAHHPDMTSLLGVPLVYGNRIIGNLYLSDKRDGEPFSQEDEELLRLLASQAAVAVRNAELYEAEQRRVEEWKALFELGQQVAASPVIKDVFESVVGRARALLNTEVATLMLITGDGASLVLAAQAGLLDPDVKRLRLEALGLQGRALEGGVPLTITDLSGDTRIKKRQTALVDAEGLQSMIVVPLVSKRGPMGTLMVANRKPTDFSEQQAELLEAFANWTVVAIESSQLYDKMESLARLEERDRIGMDLHDGVMQSIYAVGLQLEGSIDSLASSPDDSRESIDRAIDTLNNVIKDIRSYIMDLRPRVSVVADLPEALQQLVEDVRVNTLMSAEITIDGSVQGLIDRDEALALFHIAQEALNNVIKHSRATRAHVRLSSDDRTVIIEVRDNGVGIDTQRASSYDRQGLRNMRDRARSIGATLTLDSRPGEGTTVRAELPIRVVEE
jgi:signal transduction histidine kinase